jgi:hypothetical protein
LCRKSSINTRHTSKQQSLGIVTPSFLSSSNPGHHLIALVSMNLQLYIQPPAKAACLLLSRCFVEVPMLTQKS